jgi:ribosomal-protein-alanine N-acetyltransferase
MNHLKEIALIEKKSFSRPWSAGQIKNDILSEIDSENWVYITDERVLGYIFGWKLMDEYHINNFAVHPEYLRRKIGTQLIQHLISLLILKNINLILLEVSVNNIPAQKCYKSFGFTSVGVRKDYYSKGDDAILYNLNLSKND